MPTYRIHRIKDGPRENFRWAAHTGGLAMVKLKDYDAGCEIESATPYAVWKELISSTSPLRPGDLLESLSPDGLPCDLLIAKYIGFEPAQWHVPEVKLELTSAAAAPSSHPGS